MIEQVRQAHLGKSSEIQRGLSIEANRSYQASSDLIHKNFCAIRRSLQDLFDILEIVKFEKEKRSEHEKFRHNELSNQQHADLSAIFRGISKAARDILKGAYALNSQGAGLDLPENFMDEMTEEARRVLDLCNALDIPAADENFLRKVLTTIGFEGFQGLLMDDEFDILRKKPVLFKQAVMHQQGDPVAFLRSEKGFVERGVAKLSENGEFADLLEANPHVLVEAMLNYRDPKINRGHKVTNRFSNAHDYLLYLRKQKKLAKGKKKKMRTPFDRV